MVLRTTQLNTPTTLSTILARPTDELVCCVCVRACVCVCVCVCVRAQLNTEKLEYNYRVLEERDHENQSTINQQKRKIARLRDILSTLKQKYAESDKNFQVRPLGC